MASTNGNNPCLTSWRVPKSESLRDLISRCPVNIIFGPSKQSFFSSAVSFAIRFVRVNIRPSHTNWKKYPTEPYKKSLILTVSSPFWLWTKSQSTGFGRGGLPTSLPMLRAKQGCAGLSHYQKIAPSSQLLLIGRGRNAICLTIIFQQIRFFFLAH